MSKRDYRKGVLPFEFQPIPKAVLAMPEFYELPPGAKALMLDLMGQYTGKNNGRLCTAFEVLQRTGWGNKNTIIRAKAALMDCPFAVLTRKGHAPRTAEWWGFTWWKLDYEKSMDIDPRAFPYLNFIKPIAIDPNVGRPPAPKTQAVVLKRHPLNQKVILQGAETAPLEAVA